MGKSYREPTRDNRERRLHSIDHGTGPKRLPPRELQELLTQGEPEHTRWVMDSAGRDHDADVIYEQALANGVTNGRTCY